MVLVKQKCVTNHFQKVPVLHHYKYLEIYQLRLKKGPSAEPCETPLWIGNENHRV